jgi:hypothetical protein
MINHKSRRRAFRLRTRRALIAAGTVIGTTAALALFAGSASAVHDTGLFELDGNAVNSAATPGDDWDNVCHQVLGSGCSTTNNTSGATAVSWVSEPNLNATIFTGGGSKDPQDISSWGWKDGAGGLPDKDNLLHSFAARYSVPSNSHCPGAGGNTDGTKTCDVLYFGSDRYDNSGDAQQGFWFFQNPIGTTGPTSGGTFTGLHKDGDVLLVSDFSNGGSTSIITVYKWDHTCKKTGATGADGLVCGDQNLEQLATSANAKCTTAGANDAFCGLVNSGTITMPWTFADKSGTPANGALNGEFYEGGVNLSQLNLGNECFSSVASETRSSTSTTATLKDFVLGNFAQCSALFSTTPSVGAGGEVSPGSSVNDVATVQGQGTANPPTPTGNVTFHLCGPTATNSTATCTTGGTLVSTNALSNAAPPAGRAQATSGNVNTAANPLTPGRYCFRADWPGDTNYVGALSHSGTGNSECFIVRQIATTTVTTPSDSSGTALSGSQALGTTIYDTAVVTGTAIGGTPTGTVDFVVCDPGQVSGAAGSEVCAAGDGTAVTPSPTLSGVSGSSPPAASALSAGTVADEAGVWCFRATFNPSGSNGSTYTSSNDTGNHSECVTISPDSTGTVTTPQVSGSPISSAVAVGTSVTDHAVVTGTTAGGTPTGTIHFFICNPTQVAANGGDCSSGGTALTDETALAGPGATQSHADSDAVNANVVGTWCFRAVYEPDTNNYTGSHDWSTGECFTVQDSTSITSGQTWVPNDTADVTSTGGTALNGTLTIVLYESSDCSGTAVPGQTYTFTLTNAASPAERVTTNSTYSVSVDKTVSWQVTFTPAAGSNVTGNHHCETSTVTVTN